MPSWTTVAASSSCVPRRSKLVSLEFRSHYFQDTAARQAFKRFLVAQHGLDLTLWEEAGFWDSDFVPFSFFLGDEIIASTCVYSLPMVVAGEERKVAQLSSVATRADHRRQGLNRDLTERARSWWKDQNHEFCYLFADDGAFSFYAACEFSLTPQSRFFLDPSELPSSNAGDPIKLDIDNPSHRDLICDLVERRTPVSNILGHRSFSLEMFHLLYLLHPHLLHLPDLDLIVACEQRADSLYLYDLIGPAIPPLPDLLSALALPKLSKIETGFIPELLEAPYRAERGKDEDGTHTNSSFPFSNTPYRFPCTAHA